MHFRSEDVDGIRIVSAPPTELDAGKAEEFKRDIAPLVEGHPKVAIDLSEIEFMDSAGLGAMLSVFKKVRAEGGQFKVFGLTKEVEELFKLVRMQRLFGIHPDRDSVLKDFQG